MTANPEKNYYLCRKSGKGVMLEWLKRHAWKACNRQKRFGSSNLPHSAQHADNHQVGVFLF